MMDSCVEAAKNTRTAAIRQAGWRRRVLPISERDDQGRRPGHALWMLGEIASGRIEGSKAHRWLGYAQGLLVAHDLVDLHEMKDANRQASERETAVDHDS